MDLEPVEPVHVAAHGTPTVQAHFAAVCIGCGGGGDHMAVFINFGGIKIAAQSNNAGVWFGQNIQNGWDAHSVTKITSAFAMGDFNLMPSLISVYLDPDFIDSPIADQDIKGNANINLQGL